LWRFAHLQLARAPGAVDAAARTAAARLALCDDVPLEAMRQLGEGLRAALASRQLAPRPAGWAERAFGRLRLPRLAGSSSSGGGGATGPEASDRQHLSRDAFYALGGVALTASGAVAAAAERAAGAVLDSPAAQAVAGEREVVAEAVRRLGDAIAAQHGESLKDALKEAEETQRVAERARRRADSGAPTPPTRVPSAVSPPTPPSESPRRATIEEGEEAEAEAKELQLAQQPKR